MSKGFGLGYGHRILEHCTERKIQVFGHLDQIFEGERKNLIPYFTIGTSSPFQKKMYLLSQSAAVIPVFGIQFMQIEFFFIITFAGEP